MPKISVIVPIYNSEKQLAQCIESILNQTYKNFELILIDDGSTDLSFEICEVYAKRDERVLIIQKKNGGVSSARNAGLEYAKGEYITFVDSDDWIESEMLESLLEPFKNDIDLVLSGFYGEIFKDNILFQNDIVGISRDIRTDKKSIAKIYSYIFRSARVCLQSNWGNMYRRKMIIENQLKFNENLACYEDMIFNLDYLAITQSFLMIKGVFYHYENTFGEIALNRRKKSNIIEEISTTFLSFRKFLNCIDPDVNLENEMTQWFGEAYCLVLQKIIRSESITRQEVRTILEDLGKDQSFNELLNQKNINFRFYKLLRKLINLKLYFVAYYFIKLKI